MNRIVEGIEGVRVGVHVCRGNWSRQEEVLLSGDYAPLLDAFRAMKVDQFVLEFATPRAGEIDVVLVVNTWHHIAYVGDLSGVTLYIDGAPVNTTPVTPASTGAPRACLRSRAEVPSQARAIARRTPASCAPGSCGKGSSVSSS